MRRALVFLIIMSAAAGPGILAQDGIVSIDNVTNISSTGYLMAGNTHQVSIRFDFRDLPDIDWWVGSNGFEVYSPDGADWGYLQGSTGPLVAIAAGRGTMGTFEKHYYFDGSDWTQTGDIGWDPAPGSGGPDTRAGFYLSNVSLLVLAGYIGGLDNDIAILLDFETSLSDVNGTICIDSTNQITAWEWAAGSTTDFPRWDNGWGVDGPRCLEIVDCSSGDDSDGDGLVDNCDNCPDHYNVDQSDSNHDGIGDACNNEVWLEPGSGFINDSTLLPGAEHRVTFWYVGKGFTCDETWLSYNGWKLFSPDGADWGYAQMSLTPEFWSAYGDYEGSVIQWHYHKTAGSGIWERTANFGRDPVVSDQSGTDSAGWYLGMWIRSMTYYLPVGWEGPAVEIEFTSYPEDAGKHLCVDTNAAITVWEWYCGSSDAVSPLWDYSEPICFVVTDKCCFGRIGDANVSGDDEPTIGDIAYMIDRKFILIDDPGWFCLEEADVNQSGGADPTPDDITIGDISTLIDYLFITGPPLGLPDCL